MPTNLRILNKMIEEKYPGIELVQGNGCCFFRGGETAKWRVNSVPTFSVNNLSAEEWMDELDFLYGLYHHSSHALP